MIYRYHVYEELVQTPPNPHYKSALRTVLEGFPAQLLLVLDEAEVHNEIVDFDRQAVYLKITTEAEETAVSSAMHDMLKLTGLNGTRLV